MKIRCILEVPFDVYITVERDQLPDSKFEFLKGITDAEKEAAAVKCTDYYDLTDAIRFKWNDSTTDDFEIIDNDGNDIQFKTPD